MRLQKQMFDLGMRVEADLGSERMGAKIRQAQAFKVPYMLVVGDREIEEETVSLRRRDGEQINDMPVGKFVDLVQERIAVRSSEL